MGGDHFQFAPVAALQKLPPLVVPRRALEQNKRVPLDANQEIEALTHIKAGYAKIWWKT